MSWRVEALASAMSPREGQRVRARWGRVLNWARAHDWLPAAHGRAAILCFHSVTAHLPDPEVEPEALHVEDFEVLLATLHRSFRVLSLTEAVETLREGRPLPPRTVVLTFDDGYANSHSVAAEILAGMRMPWSVFLPAGLVESGRWQWTDELRVLVHHGSRRRIAFDWDGRTFDLALGNAESRCAAVDTMLELWRYAPEATRAPVVDAVLSAYSEDERAALRRRWSSFAPMTWDQARELRSSGVEVGSHGLNHVALGVQSAETLRRELVEARRLLVERLGGDGPHFSYPYGRHGSVTPLTDRMLRELGYRCGLTLEQDLVTAETAELLRLPRLIVPPDVGRLLFALWQRFRRAAS